MSELMSCPVCGHEILTRMGTICPKCNYTVGYFNGENKRKAYGKFFALTVFAPFISFITILIASLNLYSFLASVLFFVYLAYKSCPILFREIFNTKFEKILFWSIWVALNSLILFMIYNNFVRFIKS